MTVVGADGVRGGGSGSGDDVCGGGGERNGRYFIIIYDYNMSVAPVRRTVSAVVIKYVVEVESQEKIMFKWEQLFNWENENKFGSNSSFCPKTLTPIDVSVCIFSSDHSYTNILIHIGILSVSSSQYAGPLKR